MPSGDETARGGVDRTLGSKGMVMRTQSVFCCHSPVPVVEQRYESGRRPPPRYVLIQEAEPGFEKIVHGI